MLINYIGTLCCSEIDSLNLKFLNRSPYLDKNKIRNIFEFNNASYNLLSIDKKPLLNAVQFFFKNK